METSEGGVAPSCSTLFLRPQCPVRFSLAFQEAGATARSADQAKGHPPILSAPRALATLLAASTGVSDDQGIERTTLTRGSRRRGWSGVGHWWWQVLPYWGLEPVMNLRTGGIE
ncbi:MAG: hypothetical protein IVW57_05120 [Ktedonobacterales bacterium]|nr:hypothetical protein [Ktedonobacterales bacterium]